MSVIRTCGLVLGFACVSGFAVAPAAALAGARPAAPTLSIRGARVVEGNTRGAVARFRLSLSSAARRAVVVNFATVDGTARAGADYTARRGTLVIRRGSRAASVTIAVLADTVVEPDETFRLRLSKPDGAVFATIRGKRPRRPAKLEATSTIANDDVAAATPTAVPTTAAPAAPVVRGADLALSGSRLPASVRGFAPAEELLAVKNNGPDGADGVVVTATVPSGAQLSVANSSTSCSLALTLVTCPLGALAAGATASVTLAVVIPGAAAAQNAAVSATVTSLTSDPVSGNASYLDAFSIVSASQTLATSGASLVRDAQAERKSEALIGDVIADAYRAILGTDFAAQPGAGIRAPLTCDLSPSAFCPAKSGPPFTITRGAIATTLPFANRVVTLAISGSELWQMLETSVAAAPAASGSFLQVSGFCFTYAVANPAGARVQSVVRQAPNGSCTGAAVPSDSSSYTIALDSFTAAGGSGFANFSARATRHGYDADVVTDWLIASTPINPALGGRITQNP